MYSLLAVGLYFLYEVRVHYPIHIEAGRNIVLVLVVVHFIHYLIRLQASRQLSQNGVVIVFEAVDEELGELRPAECAIPVHIDILEELE